MTIPVLHGATQAPALSVRLVLPRLRDSILTLAAFGLVLAAVFGFGPFRGPGSRVAETAAAYGDGGAMARGPSLAGLSR